MTTLQSSSAAQLPTTIRSRDKGSASEPSSFKLLQKAHYGKKLIAKDKPTVMFTLIYCTLHKVALGVMQRDSSIETTMHKKSVTIAQSCVCIPDKVDM